MFISSVFQSCPPSGRQGSHDATQNFPFLRTTVGIEDFCFEFYCFYDGLFISELLEQSDYFSYLLMHQIFTESHQLEDTCWHFLEIVDEVNQFRDVTLFVGFVDA